MGRYGLDLLGSGCGVLAGTCECKISQHFKEHESSLSHSQIQATCHYPETDKSVHAPL